MNILMRRGVIGAIAGALSSAALVAAGGHEFLSVVLGAVIGAAYSATLRPTSGTYVDNLMAAAALGVPLWTIVSIIVLPLASGQMPEWTASQMRQLFPMLVGWVIYGAGLGLATQAFNGIVERALGSEPVLSPPAETEKKRIAILGGGFAGMRVAEYLEEQLGGSALSRWSARQTRSSSLLCSPRSRAAALSRATSPRPCAAACTAPDSSVHGSPE